MPRGALEHTQSADTDDETSLSQASERVLHIGRDQPVCISADRRLLRHDGKYNRPHGCNYEISVCVVSNLTDEGWAVGKGVVTDVTDEWDHRLLVESGDPLVEALKRSDDADGMAVLGAPPTTEAMVIVLEERLPAALPDTVSEVSVSVSETSKLRADS